MSTPAFMEYCPASLPTRSPWLHDCVQSLQSAFTANGILRQSTAPHTQNNRLNTNAAEEDCGVLKEYHSINAAGLTNKPLRPSRGPLSANTTWRPNKKKKKKEKFARAQADVNQEVFDLAARAWNQAVKVSRMRCSRTAGMFE
ncbi:hypothetical protein ElyMa_000771600 [Elysia marginata]|uniref:Uncharacterized protein n=1 Tax=Elysia marginata TaxID=1093978 RepID=A0AAV4GSI0_9GAST|nr:hypothetical protein ElyMa_000771600 [Elysia marginata]